MFRKNIHTKWAFTESGIMIQNVDNNCFLELNSIQERIWAYTDGTHSTKQIFERLNAEYTTIENQELVDLVEKTLEELHSLNFIIQDNEYIW